MINIRGFTFPQDACLFIVSPFILLKWRNRVNKEKFNVLLESLCGIDSHNPPEVVFLEKLNKYHKVLYFYLRKFFKEPNPCIIASLSLFNICRKKGIKATLVVGADKSDGEVIGHSWIEIGGLAVNENDGQLKKYIRMTEV